MCAAATDPRPCFNYTMASIATSDRVIERSPAAAAAAVRAIANTHAALKKDVTLATEIGRKLFPPAEADLIAELIRRDLPVLRHQDFTGLRRWDEPVRPACRHSVGRRALRKNRRDGRLNASTKEFASRILRLLSLNFAGLVSDASPDGCRRGFAFLFRGHGRGRPRIFQGRGYRYRVRAGVRGEKRTGTSPRWNTALFGGPAYAATRAFPAWTGAKLLCALSQYSYWFLAVRADLDVKRGDINAVKGLRISSSTAFPNMALRYMLSRSRYRP